MNKKELTGTLYAEMIKSGFENLKKNATVVNDLNVFPVPDGDTGENMCMTIKGGATALDKIQDIENASLYMVSSVVAKGMLLSARGNSGVILSKFFEGIAKGFEKETASDAQGFAKALMEGVKQAYSAVVKPIEGTILTVCREATVRASAAMDKNSSLESFFEVFRKELKISLERTPEKLPVLREAGVVDSGGAGLLYIADGMIRAIKGERSTLDLGTDTTAKAPEISFDDFTEDDVMQYGYCTEFLLRLQRSKVDVEAFDEGVIRDYLNTLGDSVVIFKTDSIIKAHVHTLSPGLVLEFGRKFGEFLTVKIENMSLQHNSGTIEKEAEEMNKSEDTIKMPKKKYGIVAVATGDGIKETFTSLGTDVIVEGGQSMNPSAESFIEAFDKINAETIIVLPNNGNVVMAAQQAANLYDKADVRVLECKTIGEGYAALTMADLSCDDADSVMEGLKEAMDGVKTGLVTRAVRDAQMNGVTVKEGDFIGLCGKDIICATDSNVSAACDMTEKLGGDDFDIIIVIKGKNATKEDADSVAEKLSESCSMSEIISMDGGQDVYDFIIIYE